MTYKPVSEKKDPTKEKHKGKTWKNLSSNDKDEILYRLAVKAGLFDDTAAMESAASDGVSAQEDELYKSNPLWVTVKSWFGY